MKTIMIAVAVLLSQVAAAQTTLGITSDDQLGTSLWTVIEKDQYVERLVVTYGDSLDSMTQTWEVDGLGELRLQDVTALYPDFNPETQDAYKIPLLGDQTPFQLGQRVYLQVQGAYVITEVDADTGAVIKDENGDPVKVTKRVSEKSKAIKAFLLKRPKAPVEIGITD